MVDDDGLEQAVRRSLERHAGEADTTAPVSERARGAVGVRRRNRLAIGAAAVTVLAVALTSAVLSRSDDVDGGPVDRGDDSLPTEWRTEYWRDLQVEVPADWGYGGAPMRSGGLVACYPEAMVGPDGKPLEGERTRGYVGRPIGLTDVCVPYPDNRPDGPQGPYVWLGAEIETGTVELGNGYVQETVEVNGSTMTVASDNPELRRLILDSAGEGETCPFQVDRYAQPSAFPAEGRPDGVCAYQRDGSVWRLTYFTRLEARVVKEVMAAFNAAPPTQLGGLSCDVGGFDEEFVVLMLEGQSYVVLFDHLGCPTVIGPTKSIDLKPEMTQAWSANGVRAVLDYFIGPQG